MVNKNLRFWQIIPL